MPIRIKNRDPKTTDFASNDIIINHKEGTLFFKSDTGLVKITSGSEATGGSGGTTINNATADELVTVGSTTTELDAESNLTFDGSVLTVTGNITSTGDSTLGNASTDKHVIEGNITASGNISASGDVYSNNIEILTKDTMYIYAYGKSNSSYFDPDGNPAAANDWYGPVESGLVDRSSFNYGDNTQVQTLVSKLAHTGYIVPYKCKLIGFRALAAHDDGWNTTVGTLSFALYTADGGAATFNNTASSPAATLSLTQRNEATSVTPHAKGNPVTISDLDGTYEMDAGDLIFIRAKSSTASNSTANRFYVTFAILIQRIK